jgi:RNA-directed DNA polymerase
VKAFFDSVSWELMLKAVARHTDQKWVMLYVERWLKAPMRMPDGSMITRVIGTPQGGLCAAAHNPALFIGRRSQTV